MINRGTWLKALLSSSLFFLSTPTIAAETISMQKGPFIDKGIWFLAPNSDLYQYSIYIYNNTEIMTIAARNLVFDLDNWEYSVCVGNIAYKIVLDDNSIFYCKMNDPQFDIFFIFPKTVPYPECNFILRFLDSTKPFLRKPKDGLFPFPAIIK